MARWGAVPGSTGLSPGFPPPALTADFAELADALIPLIPEDGSRITNDEIRFHGDDSNSSYVDPHDSVGAFDYVMANPPFNVIAVDMARLSGAVGLGPALSLRHAERGQRQLPLDPAFLLLAQ